MGVTWKLHRARFARLLLLGALAGTEPLLSRAQPAQAEGQYAEEVLPKNQLLELEENSGPAPTVSAAYVREEIESLNKKEPLYIKTHATFLRLLNEGWDPTLLDNCLDALGDDAVMVGMPADLVLAYYGEPLSRESIDFRGKPAELWSVEVKPGRIEKVSVADGKVVQILE